MFCYLVKYNTLRTPKNVLYLTLDKKKEKKRKKKKGNSQLFPVASRSGPQGMEEVFVCTEHYNVRMHSNEFIL